MNISARHFGSRIVPLRTRDARYDDALSFSRDINQALSGVRAAMGKELDSIDLGRIAGILQKYAGGGDTTETGVSTPTGDALAKRLAEFEHNAKVAQGYREFWAVADAR